MQLTVSLSKNFISSLLDGEAYNLPDLSGEVLQAKYRAISGLVEMSSNRVGSE